MFVCAAGDIHGAIDALYEQALAFEAELRVRFAAVLHVGDFGIWPDPERLDRATRRHDDAGDYASWLRDGKGAPRPTVFIPGNHEDFEYLAPYGQATELLPGLTYLPSSSSMLLETTQGSLRLGGVGGCYGPSDYDKPIARLKGKERRHYTREHIERLIRRTRHGRLDVLMTHDAPTGVFVPKPPNGGRVSEAQGLAHLIEATKPRLALFGHHHVRVDAEVAGVRCIGLAKGSWAGSLVGLEISADRPEWRVIGEWGGSRRNRCLDTSARRDGLYTRKVH